MIKKISVRELLWSSVKIKVNDEWTAYTFLTTDTIWDAENVVNIPFSQLFDSTIFIKETENWKTFLI